MDSRRPAQRDVMKYTFAVEIDQDSFSCASFDRFASYVESSIRRGVQELYGQILADRRNYERRAR